MPPSNEEQSSAVRTEHDILSSRASALATNLARRRSDIALMRAETATMAVSLESAKDELVDLLREEKDIRSRSSSMSLSGDSRVPDAALVKSMQGQLEVTRASVARAQERKEEIKAEISAIQQAEVEEENNSVDREEKQVEDMGRSLDEGIVRTLKEGTQSNSSFRLDHARIWRDVTMPNLALIRPQAVEQASRAKVMLGVAIERIFEGVTCFQPTQKQTSTTTNTPPKELHINPKGAMRPPSKAEFDSLSDEYATLTTRTRDEANNRDLNPVRILAPRVALERIIDLVKGEDRDKAKRPRPKLQVTEKEDQKQLSENKKQDDDSSTTQQLSKSPRSPRRTRSIETPQHVPIKLMDPSHVLHKEHFSQIMAQGVPIRFRESALELIYSTNLHGMSLHTLFNRVKTTSPTLVVIRDTKGRVFGCYAASPWKSSATRYYGTGESFVFGTDGPEKAKVYKWSRSNSFFQFTSSNFLAMGGGAGSHFALWVDEDLLMGTTSRCATFDSPPLTDVNDPGAPNCTEFKIVSLEVWSFNAHGKY